MEHNDQLTSGGYRFFYDDTLFQPGTDTFLLASLPKLKSGLRICDLGSGTGLLGLLLLQRQPDMAVTGVELLDAAADLADKTAEVNGLSHRLRTVRGDLRTCRQWFPTGAFDLVVSNPPYYPTQSGKMAPSAARRTARSEDRCTLEELCSAASYLLRWGGSFCLVHKPERLTDLLCTLRDCAIEPKRLRLVCTRPEKAPSLILVEGRRGGKPGLSIEAPLILQQADGSPTAELDALYFRQQEDTP